MWSDISKQSHSKCEFTPLAKKSGSCHGTRRSYLGRYFGRMVFKYEPLEVQDPHALVWLGFGLRAEHKTSEGI